MAATLEAGRKEREEKAGGRAPQVALGRADKAEARHGPASPLLSLFTPIGSTESEVGAEGLRSRGRGRLRLPLAGR